MLRYFLSFFLLYYKNISIIYKVPRNEMKYFVGIILVIRCYRVVEYIFAPSRLLRFKYIHVNTKLRNSS